MPTRQPAVIALVIDRLDSMETSLTNQMNQVQTHLGQRIDDLSERVKAQNSRIGKCEEAIRDEEVEVKTALAQTAPGWDRKRIAIVGGSGIVSGAAIFELVKLVIQHFAS